MSSKIYTRTGDKGKTSLIGGTKVPKSHIRIDSYGTGDELNSFIGLLSDQLSLAASAPAPAASIPVTAASIPVTATSIPVTAASVPVTAASAPVTAASAPVAAASGSSSRSAHLSFDPEIAFLREIQDRLFTLNASLACDPDKESKLKIPDLNKEDILKLEGEIDRMNEGLPPMTSFLLPGGHPAVSTAHIARCVCRRAERICVDMQEGGLFIEPLVLQYLNRLSDYLFMLARYAGHVLRVPEIPWRPRV